MRKAFNAKAGDGERLTQAMVEAFWRREHETIERLAGKGATFLPEMLTTSVGHTDPHLVERCLNAGLVPDDDVIRTAVDKRSAPIVKLLLEITRPSEELIAHISRHGTNAVREAAGLPPAQHATEPPAYVHT